MSSIRKLANQTIWYGGSYVAARFLNVFLKFVLTYLIPIAGLGVVSKVYVYTTFLSVIFTYGMETTYFRFVQQKDLKKQELFNTSFTSILLSTLLFSTAMLIWATPLAEVWRVTEHPEWIRWFAIILGFDALAAIPFARLRQEQRPVKYAFIKFLNIFLQVIFTLYFLVICPWLQARHSGNPLLYLYNQSIGVGYVFVANLIASILTMGFLYKEWLGFQIRLNGRLWREMIKYSWPLLIVGFGGMINEVVDRVLLDYLLPYSQEKRNTIIGIYYVSYQFAMLINIFIQIFKMGAEPFFFNEMNNSNARETYARVMKFFTIGSCCMYLGIVLFRDLLIAIRLVDVVHHPEYLDSFKVVPQLALGYVCLGIYYNLAVWYKVTNKTFAGAVITLVGTILTLILNFWWIPLYSYVGSAWATLICYFVMMGMSFVWGQKHYPVPYQWKRLSGYLLLAVAFTLADDWLKLYISSLVPRLLLALAFFLIYLAFVARKEREEFKKFPLIGRFF